SAAFSESHSGSPPDSSEALAQFLVATGLLTDFQSNALRGEKPPTIRVGGFVMCNDQPVRPGIGRALRMNRVVIRCGFH
ncbi:MAG: hypothetical protein AAFU85_31375, partial [Planctomycetota bacterium]